jgi:cyclopropane fatty-acyl-phospholipid synthase-like methyltransferase
MSCAPALAKQRAEAAGVAHLIDFRLCDYRLVEGTYDKIVSIEMMEALGHEYLGEFYATCSRLLAPKGLMAVQVGGGCPARHAWDSPAGGRSLTRNGRLRCAGDHGAGLHL